MADLTFKFELVRKDGKANSLIEVPSGHSALERALDEATIMSTRTGGVSYSGTISGMTEDGFRREIQAVAEETGQNVQNLTIS